MGLKFILVIIRYVRAFMTFGSRVCIYGFVATMHEFALLILTTTNQDYLRCSGWLATMLAWPSYWLIALHYVQYIVMFERLSH